MVGDQVEEQHEAFVGAAAAEEEVPEDVDVFERDELVVFVALDDHGHELEDAELDVLVESVFAFVAVRVGERDEVDEQLEDAGAADDVLLRARDEVLGAVDQERVQAFEAVQAAAEDFLALGFFDASFLLGCCFARDDGETDEAVEAGFDVFVEVLDGDLGHGFELDDHFVEVGAEVDHALVELFHGVLDADDLRDAFGEVRAVGEERHDHVEGHFLDGQVVLGGHGEQHGDQVLDAVVVSADLDEAVFAHHVVDQEADLVDDLVLVYAVALVVDVAGQLRGLFARGRLQTQHVARGLDQVLHAEDQRVLFEHHLDLRDELEEVADRYATLAQLRDRDGVVVDRRVRGCSRAQLAAEAAEAVRSAEVFVVLVEREGVGQHFLEPLDQRVDLFDLGVDAELHHLARQVDDLVEEAELVDRVFLLHVDGDELVVDRLRDVVLDRLVAEDVVQLEHGESEDVFELLPLDDGEVCLELGVFGQVDPEVGEEVAEGVLDLERDFFVVEDVEDDVEVVVSLEHFDGVRVAFVAEVGEEVDHFDEEAIDFPVIVSGALFVQQLQRPLLAQQVFVRHEDLFFLELDLEDEVVADRCVHQDVGRQQHLVLEDAFVVADAESAQDLHVLLVGVHVDEELDDVLDGFRVDLAVQDLLVVVDQLGEESAGCLVVDHLRTVLLHDLLEDEVDPLEAVELVRPVLSDAVSQGVVGAARDLLDPEDDRALGVGLLQVDFAEVDDVCERFEHFEVFEDFLSVDDGVFAVVLVVDHLVPIDVEEEVHYLLEQSQDAVEDRVADALGQAFLQQRDELVQHRHARPHEENLLLPLFLDLVDHHRVLAVEGVAEARRLGHRRLRCASPRGPCC